MKPVRFALERPGTVADAVALLGQHDGALALAGGQSLMPALNLRELRAPLLVDLTLLPELRGTAVNDRVLRIGAGIPMSELLRDPLVSRHAPLLECALGTVGAEAIRSRATLGGSAAWCDPTSQLPATLLALDATFVTTTRRLTADELFAGRRRTALHRDELIVTVELPIATRTGYGLRHVRRSAITWPVAGCAATVALDGTTIRSARIALYGGAERPLLATEAIGSLTGVEPDAAALMQAGRLAASAADPPSDERASATYRRQVLPPLVRRALADALSRA